MKPNKVLQFAQAQTAKAWTRFQLLPMRESLDHTRPPACIIEAQGERGDGTVFAVQMEVGKSLHAAGALKEAVYIINSLLQQLQTYTGCACKPGEACEKHKQVVH